MRIILRESLDNLGQAGDVVSVRAGYGRNYLLPRGLAAPATEKDVVRLEHERRTITARAAKLSQELRAQADRLAQVEVSVARAVGDSDRLYGSVNSRDIAEALGALGHAVDSRKIQLDEPIKALGTTEVPIKLGKDAVATIKVTVVKKA